MRRTQAAAFPDDTLERPLPWLPSFAVGDERMDDEHRRLLDAANLLCALTQGDARAADVGDGVRELIAATEEHFASEEALFPIIGFRRMLSHIREHLSILNVLRNTLHVTEDADLSGPAAAARMVLVDHIVRHDLAFKTWVLAARGH
jgi:hemerythrin